MKREIKFRGLMVDGGGWVNGYYWKDNTSGKHKITVDLSDDNFTCYEVIPESVGQFTGLKDKNGVEIYESDRLSNPKKESGIVVWYNSGFHLECIRRNSAVFYIPLDSGFVKNKSVTGNIHENPELL